MMLASIIVGVLVGLGGLTFMVGLLGEANDAGDWASQCVIAGPLLIVLAVIVALVL
jgi:hypothetical protein